MILKLNFCSYFQANDDSESGTIIIYSTSMGGIRSTIGDCRNVRKIFQNLRLKVDERDIFMHKEYQTELDNRVGMEGTAVPQIFVNGFWLGVSLSIISETLIILYQRVLE